MAVRNSDEVFGYVPKPLKARLKRIRKINHRYSESSLIERGLKIVVPEVEKELGLTPMDGVQDHIHVLADEDKNVDSPEVKEAAEITLLVLRELRRRSKRGR